MKDTLEINDVGIYMAVTVSFTIISKKEVESVTQINPVIK